MLLYFIPCGALESPDLLLSYSVITLALHYTIILIITHLSTSKQHRSEKEQKRLNARGNGNGLQMPKFDGWFKGGYVETRELLDEAEKRGNAGRAAGMYSPRIRMSGLMK